MRPINSRPNRGLSLLEVLAAVTILGVVATLSIMRFAAPISSGNVASCHAQRGEIELQVQLWRRNTGSYPAADLSDIRLNLSYFPEGLPVCPVDATPYTIDPATGRVVGHNH